MYYKQNQKIYILKHQHSAFTFYRTYLFFVEWMARIKVKLKAKHHHKISHRTLNLNNKIRSYQRTNSEMRMQRMDEGGAGVANMHAHNRVTTMFAKKNWPPFKNFEEEKKMRTETTAFFSVEIGTLCLHRAHLKFVEVALQKRKQQLQYELYEFILHSKCISRGFCCLAVCATCIQKCPITTAASEFCSTDKQQRKTVNV